MAIAATSNMTWEGDGEVMPPPYSPNCKEKPSALRRFGAFFGLCQRTKQRKVPKCFKGFKSDDFVDEDESNPTSCKECGLAVNQPTEEEHPNKYVKLGPPVKVSKSRQTGLYVVHTVKKCPNSPGRLIISVDPPKGTWKGELYGTIQIIAGGCTVPEGKNKKQ